MHVLFHTKNKNYFLFNLQSHLTKSKQKNYLSISKRFVFTRIKQAVNAGLNASLAKPVSTVQKPQLGVFPKGYNPKFHTLTPCVNNNLPAHVDIYQKDPYMRPYIDIANRLSPYIKQHTIYKYSQYNTPLMAKTGKPISFGELIERNGLTLFHGTDQKFGVKVSLYDTQIALSWLNPQQAQPDIILDFSKAFIGTLERRIHGYDYKYSLVAPRINSLILTNVTDTEYLGIMATIRKAYIFKYNMLTQEQVNTLDLLETNLNNPDIQIDLLMKNAHCFDSSLMPCIRATENFCTKILDDYFKMNIDLESYQNLGITQWLRAHNIPEVQNLQQAQFVLSDPKHKDIIDAIIISHGT